MQIDSFEQWQRDVDSVLSGAVGVTSDCLPDVDYWGLYQTGNTPSEAARYVLEVCAEDGYPDCTDLVDVDF